MVDDVYLDDRERAEKVKQWWKENGLSIVGGAALGLVAIFGWRAWQAQEQAHMESAAAAYESFQASAQMLSPEDIEARMEEFRSEFSDTPYAALAAMEGGLLYYRAGEAERAESLYRYAIQNARPPELRDVARLRLARVAMDRGNLEEALATLDEAEADSFANIVNELRGDVLARQGRTEEARAAYEAAREAGDGGTRYLDLKIASLGSGILASEDEGS